MNYAQIKEYDIANGPGVRLTLFVSGCTHHCKGCFNAKTWDFAYGQPYTREVEDALLQEVSAEWYKGLTLLGGEPMEPVNQKALVGLLRRFKERYPQKTVWCFSGYLFDRDLAPGGRVYTEDTAEMLSYIDVLVDGEFVEALKDVTLLYKGSSNQRTIDVPASLRTGRICLWDGRDVTVSASTRSSLG